MDVFNFVNILFKMPRFSVVRLIGFILLAIIVLIVWFLIPGADDKNARINVSR